MAEGVRDAVLGRGISGVILLSLGGSSRGGECVV